MAKAPIHLYVPGEVTRQLAERIRAERLRRGWKQETLAKRSGVSLPTVRRYERTGRTSVENLLRLCHALGRLAELAELLQPPPAWSMAELESRATNSPGPKRGVR
ncbi:transcriptional regulator [mine drainage metagenome]|uniref:Transcriptional regulator n=1 Tax=mine drainage metagenome TaxID=410659 RepID=T0ZFY4_9ZZZZ